MAARENTVDFPRFSEWRKSDGLGIEWPESGWVPTLPGHGRKRQITN